MPADWIPGISQIKSVVQLVSGDAAGAVETQKNFFQECPVVSQGTSLVQLATGDVDGAIETQKRCFETVDNVTNSVPVVGHAKSAVLHLCGDHEGGNEAFNAATRTTVVMGTGAVVAVTTGGVGAIPAGIAAGVAYDKATTAITGTPQGSEATYQKLKEEPSAGNFFEVVFGHVSDGATGYAGGKAATKSNKVDPSKQTNKGNKISGKGGSLKGMRFRGASTAGVAIAIQIAALSMLPPEACVKKRKQDDHDVEEQDDDDDEDDDVEEQDDDDDEDYREELYDDDDDDDDREELYDDDLDLDDHLDVDDLEELDIFKLIDDSLDSALIHDFYVNEEATETERLSDEEKKSNLEDFSNQSAQTESLKSRSHYSNATMKSLTTKKNQFRKDKNNNKLKKLVTERNWLHVRMPETFNYTGAILLNHHDHGLYHSILRHHDQWRDFIPNFANELQHENFSDLQSCLQKLCQAENYLEARRYMWDYLAALTKLQRNNYQRFLDVQSSLHGLQLDLYSFIQNNVTYENYLGEGVTVNNQVRLFFKVKDMNGNTKVMALGVSSDMYPAEDDFGDDRPIRTIITAFIMSWETFKKQNVLKLYPELDIFRLTDDDSLDSPLVDFYAKEKAEEDISNQKAEEDISNQSVGTQPLKTSFSYSISTRESLISEKKEFGKDKKEHQLKQLVSQRNWVHVRMPRTFNYTGVILLNHVFNGLYRSVIRPHDPWRNFIPSFQTELEHENFNDLQLYLRNISEADNHLIADIAIRDYIEILRDLRLNNPPRFLAVQSSLHGIQLDLHRFIGNNITSENYLGEGVTANNQVLIFFKYQRMYGKPYVLALEVSSDKYTAESDFGDAREIRIIKAVFIMSWETYEEQFK